ncbi:MAG TPA: DUF6644 family protein [Bryobacteraceae bacterium]|nr:DUF6644 family protein [Bryobacteraceae bacterium]
MSLYGIAQWLEHTEWSLALHESIWAYPIIESVHVLCLCLFLGMALALDLRLLGVAFRGVDAGELFDRLMPFTVTGFILMVVTGTLLFFGIPVRTYVNIFFRLKMLFLILSGINVWYFHSGIHRNVGEWGRDANPPAKAKMVGAVSIVLWALIVIAGRMIAYNWFDKTL